MKCCTKCKKEKPLEDFSFQEKGKYGVTSICKPCSSERGKNWRLNNLERSKENAKKYQLANKERQTAYSKEWREKHSDRIKVVAALWTASNLEKKAAATARRRAAKICASPSWALAKDIKPFYVLAASMTKKYRIKTTVDHVVPLQSPLVCGLHCAANLSIQTDSLNKRKGNLWWPQMWGRDEELDA